MLEALAMGRPVATTSAAARGHALFANEPAEFASACLRLLRDEALAQRLVSAGRDWVQHDGSSSRRGNAAISLVSELL